MNHRLDGTYKMVLLLLLFLAGRLFYVQILLGVNYSEMAQREYKKKVIMEPLRGEILDRNGIVLAKTIEGLSVYIRPKEIKKNKQTVQALKSVVSERPVKLNSKKDFIWLARKWNPDRMEPLLDKKFPGVGIVSEQKRYYPNGSLACYVLGTVGMDNHGLSGLEQSLDTFLIGKSCTIDQLRDGRGRNLIKTVQNNLSPNASESLSSNSVLLTLDRNIQYIAERELKKTVEEVHAIRGSVLIQNPHTGELLALASYPGFDPNQTSVGNSANGTQNLNPQNSLLNRLFEPGSTFKLITFSAALEEKKWSLTEPINCEGGKWNIGSTTIRDHEPSQVLTFSEVLEKSSNIGTAKIGLRLVKETFYQYMRAFGFGTKTGLNLPGESEGILHLPDQWSGSSQITMAFGQGIGVTAIQLINAYSAIANDGKLMEPLLIRQVEEQKGSETKKTIFTPQVVRQVVSQETSKTLRELLHGVVERGTGVQAKIPGYSIAGKTGTAQKIDPVTKKYSHEKFIASFCGFLPADKPELVCLVLLDEPKKEFYGGETAAPLFARIIAQVAPLVGIQKSPTLVPITLASKK